MNRLTLSRGLGGLLRTGFDAARWIGIDEPLECRRAWPFGDGGWAAVLGSDAPIPTSSWALLKPGRAWPSPLRRLFDQGESSWLPDQDVAVWPLAAEPVVSGLHDWLDPAHLDLPGGLHRGEVVSYKPLRRVVTVFASDREPLYFVKHLRRHHARRSVENQRLVASWWRDSPEFALPPLVDGGASPGYVVWRAVPGSPPRRLAPSGLRRAVHAAGRCLGSLHQCPAQLSTHRSRASEVETTGAWLELMSSAFERSASLDHGLFTLGASADWLPRSRPVVSHGDFHDGQLLFGDERTTLLDLDTLSLAEPELDVGNFLAHLDLLVIDRPELGTDDLERVVLEGYAQIGGPGLSMPLIAWYRAAAALRLVCVHTPRPESRPLLPGLTDRAMELAREFSIRRGQVAS